MLATAGMQSTAGTQPTAMMQAIAVMPIAAKMPETVVTQNILKVCRNGKQYVVALSVQKILVSMDYHTMLLV
jgi:hypothetical protein